MLVEGLEGADEDAAVLQDAPHPEVDVLQHLAALPHSLQRSHTRTIISQLQQCYNCIKLKLAWIILSLLQLLDHMSKGCVTWAVHQRHLIQKRPNNYKLRSHP